MQARIYKLAALAVCLCTATAGCAATADGAAGLLARFSGKKTPEQMLNIKTPEDHLNDLRELAKTAKKKSPAEQEHITATLANQIHSEQDPLMRRQILRTLSAYPTPLAFTVLSAGLNDSDTETRRVACECFARQGGARAVPELSRVANSDTDVDVRIAAIRALGETRDKGALAPLAEALVDPDPAVQFRAAASLRSVSGRDFGSDVGAWREYAKTGTSSAPDVGFAERFRRNFF